MAIDQVELGRRIRQARESCGMTQDEVADKLDISRPTVVQIEQGKRPVSGLELQTLAYLFARDIRDLLTDDPATSHGAAQDPVDAAVAMIGTVRAVLAERAPEL